MIFLLLFLGILFFPKNVEAMHFSQDYEYKNVKVSWYAKGLKNPEAFTTACWDEFKKGTKFRVTYNTNSIIVICTDRGHFKELGRFLDLSSGAFKSLAPLSKGIIKVNVEVLTI